MGFDTKDKVKNSEPEAIRLTNLVDYEAASISSRALIDRKATSITAFAFDNFQGIVDTQLHALSVF